jgi:hypothetical protein
MLKRTVHIDGLKKKTKPYRIFTEDSPTIITHNVFINLEEYYKKMYTYKRIFSPSGIFHISHNNIVRYIPYDGIVKKLSIDSVNLLVDYSFFKEECEFSQIPLTHEAVDLTSFHYCIGEKSNLMFVVEGHYETKLDSTYTTTSSQVLKVGIKKYENFIPTNFYFLVDEEFDNYLIKKELNVFLSLLN